MIDMLNLLPQYKLGQFDSRHRLVLVAAQRAKHLLQGKTRGFELGKFRILEKIGSGANGTVYLWSHGYRYPVDLPAAIPVVGGYKVVNIPEPAPSTDIAKALLGSGYGIVGSGYAKRL